VSILAEAPRHREDVLNRQDAETAKRDDDAALSPDLATLASWRFHSALGCIGRGGVDSWAPI
jgi:hypothetical protein